MDGNCSIAQTPSIKPTVRPGIAARHARDLNDIRLLKARVLDAAQLGGELIDWGHGYRNSAHEVECALLNPEFMLSPRERANLQADADSHHGLELACRDELAALPAWTELVSGSTWAELAAVARLRDSIA